MLAAEAEADGRSCMHERMRHCPRLLPRIVRSGSPRPTNGQVYHESGSRIRREGQHNQPEGALGINVKTLALSTTHVKGQLTCYGKSVADLALSRSEFSEDLSDRAGLDATGQEGVKLLRTGRDGDKFATSLVHFRCGGEAHGNQLSG